MERDHQRDTLDKYMDELGPEGAEEYKQKNNLNTIDRFKTRLAER
tara:strand:- start:1740 stop:1874 length:135 start_codon:yes stop_codon:yes gene_type:complete